MKKCHACGAEMPDNAKWCSNCGAKLEDIPAIPKQNRSSLTIAVWVVAALLLVAIILFIFTRNQGNENINLADSISDTTVISTIPLPQEMQSAVQTPAKPETIRVVQEEAEPIAVENWQRHTISGNYYDTSGSYPVKITFEKNDNGEIRDCTLVNVNYGTTIRLNGTCSDGSYSFNGQASGQSYSIRLRDVGGGTYQGSARFGDKEVTISASGY